jgi:hypothetical protein
MTAGNRSAAANQSASAVQEAVSADTHDARSSQGTLTESSAGLNLLSGCAAQYALISATVILYTLLV